MLRSIKKKKFLGYIGLSLIIIEITTITGKVSVEKTIQKEEKNLLQLFFEQEKEKQPSTDKKSTYIAVIEIPKIHLKRGLVESNHPDNTIEKNIQIISPSDMPNIPNGNLILAAHSGTGSKAFFKNLDQLALSDIITIYYNKIKYTYQIINIYEEIKDGDIQIKKEPKQTTLTLTTCKPNTKDRQLIIIAEQITKEAQS